MGSCRSYSRNRSAPLGVNRRHRGRAQPVDVVPDELLDRFCEVVANGYLASGRSGCTTAGEAARREMDPAKRIIAMLGARAAVAAPNCGSHVAAKNRLTWRLAHARPSRSRNRAISVHRIDRQIDVERFEPNAASGDRDTHLPFRIIHSAMDRDPTLAM